MVNSKEFLLSMSISDWAGPTCIGLRNPCSVRDLSQFSCLWRHEFLFSKEAKFSGKVCSKYERENVYPPVPFRGVKVKLKEVIFFGIPPIWIGTDESKFFLLQKLIGHSAQRVRDTPNIIVNAQNLTTISHSIFRPSCYDFKLPSRGVVWKIMKQKVCSPNRFKFSFLLLQTCCV